MQKPWDNTDRIYPPTYQSCRGDNGHGTPGCRCKWLDSCSRWSEGSQQPACVSTAV